MVHEGADGGPDGGPDGFPDGTQFVKDLVTFWVADFTLRPCAVYWGLPGAICGVL